MRSVEPMPGEPWPHDMLISVTVDTHLTTLLFVRAVWGIAGDADVPPLDPTPEAGESAVPSWARREEWTDRWIEQWRTVWEWFDVENLRSAAQNPELLRAAIAGEGPSPWFPPMWESEYGYDGIDTDALRRWEESLTDDHSLPFDEHPERRCLDALIPAWRAGIDSIIVLPYRGYFARRVTKRHLAVSKATRDDPVLYDLALSTVN